MSNTSVDELTIDEFTKYLENNQITELEIINKVKSENYEVSGKIKEYEESKEYIRKEMANILSEVNE